jgi:hypothetical protein
LVRRATDTFCSPSRVWKTLLPRDPDGIELIQPIVMTPDGNSYCYSYLRTISNLFVTVGAVT